MEEIGFEEFLTVMSHFRPLKQNLTQEEKERIRREKLRCEHTHTHTYFIAHLTCAANC